MKRTLPIVFLACVAPTAFAGNLYIYFNKKQDYSTNTWSWGGTQSPSIMVGVASVLGTAGAINQLAACPNNGQTNSVSASIYDTATYQFGFHTVTNEAPPTFVYLYYGGTTETAALEPTGPFASYGATAQSSSSTFPNLNCSVTWNNTAKFGIIFTWNPQAVVQPNSRIAIPASAFGGWKQVSKMGSDVTYVSNGSWTLTTPTIAVGGLLGSGTVALGGAGWGLGFRWALQ